jgi:hypothetical protein
MREINEIRDNNFVSGDTPTCVAPLNFVFGQRELQRR